MIYTYDSPFDNTSLAYEISKWTSKAYEKNYNKSTNRA